ncbi:hypothetical protein, partial [Salinispira pacifica]
MQKIRSIRGEYYTLWEELINTIRNEPDKPEKAIAIINKMKQLDAAPNERTKQNINEWENIVQFRYNLDRFNKIMVAGDQLLRQSRFEEAIKTYTEGFDIFRPEFEAAGYSQQQVVDRANEEARQVSASVDQFLADMSKVSTAAKSFSSALPSGTPEEMAAQYSQFASQFTQVLTVHQTLESAAETFKNLNDEVRKERPSLQQDWYLTFMSWYIRGRPESNSPEGIGAAISAFLDQSQAVADAAMKARASADYEKALAAFESGPPDRAIAAFTAAQSTSLLGLDLERLWERRLNPGPGLGLSSTDRSAVEAHLPVYLQYEYQARASRSYLEVIGVRSDTGTISVADADTVATLAPKREQLKSALDTVGSIVTTWKDIQNRIGDGLSGYVGPDGKAVVDRAVSDFDREL